MSHTVKSLAMRKRCPPEVKALMDKIARFKEVEDMKMELADPCGAFEVG